MSNSCCDDCDNLGVAIGPAGPAGEAGSGGSSQLSLNNSVFVAKNGSDSTGLVNRIDKPFLTILAAEAAASASYTIFVYPGTYTDVGLGKNGVKYYFNIGANISTASTTSIWTDQNTVISYEVDGYGEFRGAGDIIDLRAASTFKMTANRLECTGSAGVCVRAMSISASTSGANVDVKINGDIYSPLFFGVRIQTINNSTITQNVRIEADTISADYPVLILKQGAPLSTMNILVVADLVKVLGNTASASALRIYNADTFNFTKFYAKAYVNKCWRSIANGVGSSEYPAVAGHFMLYGDIQCDDKAPMFGYGSFAGTHVDSFDYIIHRGNGVGNGSIMYTSDNSSNHFELYGNYISANDATYARMAIETAGAREQDITIQGLVKTLGTGAACQGIAKTMTTGGDFTFRLLSGTRLVTTNSGVNCLTSDGAAQYFDISLGVHANKAVGALVIERISSVLIDANVS